MAGHDGLTKERLREFILLTKIRKYQRDKAPGAEYVVRLIDLSLDEPWPAEIQSRA